MINTHIIKRSNSKFEDSVPFTSCFVSVHMFLWSLFRREDCSAACGPSRFRSTGQAEYLTPPLVHWQQQCVCSSRDMSLDEFRSCRCRLENIPVSLSFYIFIFLHFSSSRYQRDCVNDATVWPAFQYNKLSGLSSVVAEKDLHDCPRLHNCSSDQHLFAKVWANVELSSTPFWPPKSRERGQRTSTAHGDNRWRHWTRNSDLLEYEIILGNHLLINKVTF